MKHTILILAILAMAGVGYGYDFSEEAEIVNNQTGANEYLQVMEETNMIIKGEMPDILFQIDHEGNFNADGLIDLLERCKEFLRDGDRDMRQTAHTTLEYRPLTRRSVIEDEIKSYQQELERLERETQLLRDIEAALKALQ